TIHFRLRENHLWSQCAHHASVLAAPRANVERRVQIGRAGNQRALVVVQRVAGYAAHALAFLSARCTLVNVYSPYATTASTSGGCGSCMCQRVANVASLTVVCNSSTIVRPLGSTM